MQVQACAKLQMNEPCDIGRRRGIVGYAKREYLASTSFECCPTASISTWACVGMRQRKIATICSRNLICFDELGHGWTLFLRRQGLPLLQHKNYRLASAMRWILHHTRLGVRAQHAAGGEAIRVACVDGGARLRCLTDGVRNRERCPLLHKSIDLQLQFMGRERWLSVAAAAAAV
jgi:hypothetical protein